MALQNEKAKATLQLELLKNPNNIIPVYLADYDDCLRLLFNGNAVEYAALKNNQETRIDAIEKGNRNSPWYLFCKANIYMHWALVNARFGDNFKAATKFRKSFLLLKENKTLYPHFEENNVLLGLEQAVAGAMPDNYKWLGSVLGIKGNINKGVGEIVAYLNAHPDGNAAMHEEAMIYYAYLKFYLLNAQDASWKFVNSGKYNETNNLMRSFIKANLALNYRKAEDANTILTQASGIKEFNRYPIFYYEQAEASLAKLDLNAATKYQLFIKEYKGAHFVKDAWLKLSWIAYLQNNKKRMEYCITQIKERGNTATDADKQALRFAENPMWPNPVLLQVRLLIDGGFYKNALIKMQSIDKNELGTVVNMLDYNFRYGRIFEELGEFENALIFYTATINTGRGRKEYYAARAALQKGFIYEKTNKKTEAIAQYKDCLSMRDHDAQSSIDQLAKAGLNRLGM